ncbi:VOC family protein [Campylobacter rectus]
MNKITCICLGVRSMQRALKFYRDGLGYETDCKDDDPPVCFFNTPGTKFELYPLGALARDIDENDPPRGSGFGGITLAYNVKNKEDVGSVIELVKRRAEPSSRSPKMRFGADITHILPIRTDTTGRWFGGPVLNLTRMGCSNFRVIQYQSAFRL